MVALAKALRQLMALGDFRSVKRLVEDSADGLADVRVRRDYIRALDALGERAQSERVLAQHAASFIDDAASLDGYLKREAGRIFTEEEIEALTRLIEIGGPAVRARRAAMQMSVGQIDAALQSTREAIQSAATTHQSANVAASLGDLFFRHGRLDLVDDVIDQVDAPEADRIWLKAQRRFQLDFSEHATSLMRACLADDHPHHQQARRAWFDHQWVEIGPCEGLLEESEAWSASAQDPFLQACRISLLRQLGMDDRARRTVEASPEALAWHGSFLSLLDFVEPNALRDDAAIRKLEDLKGLRDHLIGESAPQLAEAIRRPRLAIVGNAPSEFGLGRGVAIDAHDTVVRFTGGGTTDRVEMDYGRKTDIHILPISNSAGGLPVSKEVLVLFTVPYPIYRKSKWDKALKLRSEGHRLAVSPGSSYSDLVRHLKRPPSSGVRVAALAKSLRGTTAAVDLFGFSAFSQSDQARYSFYDDSRPSQHHAWAAEAEWLRTEFTAPHVGLTP